MTMPPLARMPAGTRLPPTDWSRYTLEQMWDSLQADDAVTDRQIMAWRRMSTLLAHHARVLRRAADELAHHWAPEVSQAARTFQARVTELSGAMDSAAGIAGSNGAAVILLMASLVDARREVGALQAEWPTAQTRAQEHPFPERVEASWRQEFEQRARVIMRDADTDFAESHRSLHTMAVEPIETVTPWSTGPEDQSSVQPTKMPGDVGPGNQQSSTTAHTRGGPSLLPGSGVVGSVPTTPDGRAASLDDDAIGRSPATSPDVWDNGGLASGPVSSAPPIHRASVAEVSAAHQPSAGSFGTPVAGVGQGFRKPIAQPSRSTTPTRGTTPTGEAGHSAVTGRPIGGPTRHQAPGGSVHGPGGTSHGPGGPIHAPGGTVHGPGSPIHGSGAYAPGGVIGGQAARTAGRSVANVGRAIPHEEQAPRPEGVRPVIEADPEPLWHDPGPGVIGIDR